MIHREGSPDAGRQTHDDLPTFILSPLKVFHKLIPVLPNENIMLTLSVISEEQVKAHPILIRTLFEQTVHPGTQRFITVNYGSEVSTIDFKAQSKVQYSVDSPDIASKYISGQTYDNGAVDDLRIRFRYYYRLETQSGKSAPVDLCKYAEEMLRYFLDNSVITQENGQIHISLPSSGKCPHAEELLEKYEAVSSAFDKVKNAVFIISSNAVYTGLFSYIDTVLKNDIAENTLYSLVESAAIKASNTVSRQFTQAKAEEYDEPVQNSPDVTDKEITGYLFDSRIGCKYFRRLLAMWVILRNAELYRNEHNGKDERSRERIIRAKCDVRKFYNEFIVNGITVGELYEWTIAHLKIILNLTVYPYSKMQTENKLRAIGIYDTPVMSLLPSEWDQYKMSEGCSAEEVHSAFISHFTGQLRGVVLVRFYPDGTLR